MQTFSDMQRSISHQKPLVTFTYIFLYLIYESFSSIYLFLPPMFAVLFVLYSQAMDKRDFLLLTILAFCLILYEADKGYLLFSSIIYFTLVNKFIIPKIIKNFNCNSCVKILYVVIAYLGYYIFLLLIAKIFLLEIPSINYYIVYYIVIEFFIVGLL